MEIRVGASQKNDGAHARGVFALDANNWGGRQGGGEPCS